MEQLPLLMHARQPKGALIEEVPALLTVGKDGTSPCQRLVDRLHEVFDGVEVVLLDAAMWSDISRSRTLDISLPTALQLDRGNILSSHNG